ncbi:endolytic transglycosylase MltG [Hyphobacterium sp. HN65]|uniref:Endolytic murein transglycosylase n=1 Tax=Hyphobacterium lacteum TaxID=3116575 RepID=A0ABU7LLL0_9PROT|nr:endolytic transglycosylase MltG [Hyphobacterium sp. HN65]MEE2524772.1 endolytic transglycosylase MltG [Hyphobacterium sp. HN65]
MSETRSEKKSSGLIGKLLVWALILLLGGALLLAGGAFLAWNWMQGEVAEPGPAAEETIVTLPRGSGLIAIANRLEEAGVIEDAQLFRIWVTIDGGDRDLRAGEYAIPAGASLQDIYDQLRSGDTIQYFVTAPEGRTSAQIVRILNENPVLTGEITEVPAEGTLLPETYSFHRGDTRQHILDRMREDQQALLDQLWPDRADDLPFDTPEEAIILASIVEKETGVASERPLVASVFVNRLRRGMMLESDPTIIYGITGGEPLGRGIRRSELDNDQNPYNTYFIDGLTPTPIANPGRDAIAAVLNPPDTGYLFFVADGTGGHAFAETYREHQRNVANWRRIERERR